jgi:hypothetical protein
MPEFIQRFLDKLAKANQREFQGERPDCCTINRQKQEPKPSPGASAKKE